MRTPNLSKYKSKPDDFVMGWRMVQRAFGYSVIKNNTNVFIACKSLPPPHCSANGQANNTWLLGSLRKIILQLADPKDLLIEELKAEITFLKLELASVPTSLLKQAG